jgi:beta-lactamase class A
MTMTSPSQPKNRGSGRTFLWVLVIGILLLLVFALQDSSEASSTSTNTAAAARVFEQAKDESAQNDALNTESVNTERLRHRVQTNSLAPVDTTALDSQINDIINQNPDIVFGVSITDLNTGTVHDYGNKNAMTAASVTKVLTAVDYLKQVELGNKSLSTIMANGYTAQYNMEQMIVVSNNDSWHILNESLGYSQMQEYAQSIGLESYYYGDNVISAADTAQLLGDMYQRKLINESNTQLLLSYMERANYRDLIIPAVPAQDTIYHKAGEYLINLNDAAIITNTTNTIVISIFTESLYYYDKPRVSALMQQITTPTIETFHLNQ